VGSLPDWLDPLYEAEEMRAADTYAIEQAGVASVDLMERAAIGLARVVAGHGGAGPVRVVVGKGNNGGDGLAAARLLREDGHRVDVLAAASLDDLGPDAAANRDRLPGAPPRTFSAGALDGSGVVVDCLLGTGFAGSPRGEVAEAIEAICGQPAPVVACDVPSGVDASTGRVGGLAVTAVATATFHAPKVGLYVEPGKSCAGAVEIVEIGIPRGAPAPARAGLISERVLDLYPRRGRSGSKFDSGVVVVAGGSSGLTGAPVLAARAAARAGAGYVQVAVPASVERVVELRLLEQMTHGLPEDAGGHTEQGVPVLAEMAERAGAVVLGPGLGRSQRAQEFGRRAAAAIPGPLLLDADGLNAHAGRLDMLAARDGPTVLTPHEAELARLLGTEPAEVAADRRASAARAAKESGAIVVLKGDDTIVAAPGGPLAVNPGGSAALATAGTGDVLSGLVGCLLAKGLDPFTAACLGVSAHGLAGCAAAARVGADHTVAGDVIEALPHGLTLR